MDITAFRQALGLTQSDLAEKLGVDQATISRLETGKLPINKRTQLALEALKARLAA
jgi:transcriptional regulator with XRE-family HTH domain